MLVLCRPHQLTSHTEYLQILTQPPVSRSEPRLTDDSVQIDFFSGPHAVENHDLIVAGGATSGAVTKLGQLYTWGQVKKVGESQVRFRKVLLRLPFENCVQDAASKDE
jgi:hypothetical protein